MLHIRRGMEVPENIVEWRQKQIKNIVISGIILSVITFTINQFIFEIGLYASLLKIIMCMFAAIASFGSFILSYPKDLSRPIQRMIHLAVDNFCLSVIFLIITVKPNSDFGQCLLFAFFFFSVIFAVALMLDFLGLSHIPKGKK